MPRLNSLCVYCGSVAPDRDHERAARALGRLAAERDVEIVFGGGRVGLMGVVAEAATQAGGRVVGVIPEFLQQREVGKKDITELVVVDTMHSRKTQMFERADAFCALPGGLGTLDEIIEVATWKQLGLHDKPLILFSPGGYWTPLLDLIRHQAAAGYVRQENLSLLTVVESIEGVFEAAETAPPPRRASRAGRL